MAAKKSATKKRPAKRRVSKAPAKKRAGASPRDVFAKWVRTLLAEHPNVASVKRVRGDFALKVVMKDDYESVLYLASAFAETRELAPDAREHFIRTRFYNMLSRDDGDDRDTWDAVQHRLFPTLRAASFGLHALLQAKRGTRYSVLRRSFVPNVNLQVAIDSEQQLTYATSDNLAKWGVTETDAIARALENAREHFTEPVLYDETHGPMFHIAEDDDYQSSRLALPGLLASHRGRVEGTPIAIIPDRAQLYIAGDARDEMVERMVDMAQREWDASSRAISPALYTVDEEGRVVPYVRRSVDALARKIQLGHVRLALREYSEQKEVLDKLNERDGVDIFVATLNGLLRNDGRPVTWALWGENIDTLLPFAELVIIDGGTDDARWSLKVPFEACAEVMGDAWVVADDMSPPRVHPQRWPTDAELARLRAAATDIDALPG